MKKRTLGITLALAFTTIGVLSGCGQKADQTTAAETGVTDTTSDAAAGSAAGAESKTEETVKDTDDSLQKIKDSGVLRIGTEGTYAPYSYHDENGNLIGFDVEIAELVAERLGVKPEFIETKWDAMIAGLDADRFDIIVNQVGITEERQEKYDFSEPYTYIHGALIVAKDNDTIKTFDDIKGKKSAQTLTSNWGKTAEEYGAELVGVDGFDQSVELVESGRADLTINSEVALYDYLKQKPDAGIKKVALSDDPSIVGIPVPKGETSLYEAINQTILDLKQEGKLKEVSEKYFGTDITQE